MGEARIFKYGAEIDIDKYHCLRDRLPVRTVYFFLENNRQFLRNLQDRDIAAMED